MHAKTLKIYVFSDTLALQHILYLPIYCLAKNTIVDIR
jgi:hypothetical protein